MFTGLVQHVGRIVSTRRTDAGARLVLDPVGWAHRAAAGDSIAINGVCLTVVELTDRGWAFDVVPETLSRTTIGSLSLPPGAWVNLEHAVTPATLLGGHLVQGHVDGVALVARVQSGSDWRVEFRPPADLMACMIPKGSVCVDGVSLTLARVDPGAGTFEVALIPETLERTTLRSLRAGQHANVEADATVKAIVHVLRHYGAASQSGALGGSRG